MFKDIKIIQSSDENVKKFVFKTDNAISVLLDSLIEQLKKYGYSVFIRNSGSKKVIMWSTQTHWASASFVENSDNDLKRVCQRLKETIYNVSFSNAR